MSVRKRYSSIRYIFFYQQSYWSLRDIKYIKILIYKKHTLFPCSKYEQINSTWNSLHSTEIQLSHLRFSFALLIYRQTHPVSTHITHTHTSLFCLPHTLKHSLTLYSIFSHQTLCRNTDQYKFVM